MIFQKLLLLLLAWPLLLFPAPEKPKFTLFLNLTLVNVSNSTSPVVPTHSMILYPRVALNTIYSAARLNNSLYVVIGNTLAAISLESNSTKLVDLSKLINCSLEKAEVLTLDNKIAVVASCRKLVRIFVPEKEPSIKNVHRIFVSYTHKTIILILNPKTLKLVNKREIPGYLVKFVKLNNSLILVLREEPRFRILSISAEVYPPRLALNDPYLVLLITIKNNSLLTRSYTIMPNGIVRVLNDERNVYIVAVRGPFYVIMDTSKHSNVAVTTTKVQLTIYKIDQKFNITCYRINISSYKLPKIIPWDSDNLLVLTSNSKEQILWDIKPELSNPIYIISIPKQLSYETAFPTSKYIDLVFINRSDKQILIYRIDRSMKTKILLLPALNLSISRINYFAELPKENATLIVATNYSCTQVIYIDKNRKSVSTIQGFPCCTLSSTNNFQLSVTNNITVLVFPVLNKGERSFAIWLATNNVLKINTLNVNYAKILNNWLVTINCTNNQYQVCIYSLEQLLNEQFPLNGSCFQPSLSCHLSRFYIN
jgi:hypothetical protein